MDDRVLEPGRAILAQLQRLVRELVNRKAGGHLIESQAPPMHVDLEFGLGGADADPDTFARKLVEGIDRRLDEAVEHRAAFRPGHAFCLRCGGPDCEHSLPPSARHVLRGYTPTGTPRWEDFAQVMLDLRVDGVDALYQDPPAFLTVVQGPDDVHAGLVRAFEHPSYRLLGQLLAGYFPVRATDAEGRGVVALTFQVAGTRTRRGMRLGLNVLGRSPSGEDLGTLWERHRELPWRRGVRWAQAALTTIRGGRERDPERLEQRVQGILSGLARRMQREQRARRRRTRHAEDRHDSGRRPTRMAMEDVRGAAPEDFLVDERSGSRVVLGDRGRTHFFSADGRLVSSVRYRRDAIRRKIDGGVWRAADEAEVADLLVLADDGGVGGTPPDPT
jgi:hypothetical protein